MEKIVQARIKRTNELTIYYHVGTSNSYLFVLGLESSPRAVRLKSNELRADLTHNISAKRIEVWVKEYHRLFSERGGFPGASTSEKEHLASITDQLLPPELYRELTEKMKRGNFPLIVSPSGQLQQIPFDALWVQNGDHASFLTDCFPTGGIVYTPSLVILDALEQTERAVPSTISLATVACSAVVGMDPLPLATEESKAVAKAFADSLRRRPSVPARG